MPKSKSELKAWVEKYKTILYVWKEKAQHPLRNLKLELETCPGSDLGRKQDQIAGLFIGSR